MRVLQQRMRCDLERQDSMPELAVPLPSIQKRFSYDASISHTVTKHPKGGVLDPTPGITVPDFKTRSDPLHAIGAILMPLPQLQAYASCAMKTDFWALVLSCTHCGTSIGRSESVEISKPFKLILDIHHEFHVKPETWPCTTRAWQPFCRPHATMPP